MLKLSYKRILVLLNMSYLFKFKWYWDKCIWPLCFNFTLYDDWFNKYFLNKWDKMIISKLLYASKHSPPFYFSLFCPYHRWGRGDLSWAISFLIYLNVTNILKSWIFCCMLFKYIFCFTLLFFYKWIRNEFLYIFFFTFN